ncbi:MAG: AF1514 family protein [bacterium]
MNPRMPERGMLVNPIDVRIDDGPLDFVRAKRIADEKARAVSPEAVLLAWFDRREGTFSPAVTCCDEQKPAWLVYAESRGADIVIDINGEEFIFVYVSESSCPP